MIFFVNPCYATLERRDNEAIVNENKKTRLSNLWKSKTPLNVLIFCWTMILNKLPTRDKLMKRDIILAAAVFCVFRWMKITITSSLIVQSLKGYEELLIIGLAGRREAKICACQVSFFIVTSERNRKAETLSI